MALPLSLQINVLPAEMHQGFKTTIFAKGRESRFRVFLNVAITLSTPAKNRGPFLGLKANTVFCELIQSNQIEYFGLCIAQRLCLLVT